MADKVDNWVSPAHYHHVFHRQRPRERHLARWRQYAVPARGYELGRLRRVPCFGAWPGNQGKSTLNGIVCHQTCYRPLAARASQTSTRNRRLQSGVKTFNVHIDGQPAALSDRTVKRASNELFVSDDGESRLSVRATMLIFLTAW